MKGLLSKKRAQTVLQWAFIFLELRNIILLRGVWRMKCKLSIQENSHSNHLSPPERAKRTKSAPTGLCPAGPDIVWILNLSQTASLLRELYKYPYCSNGSLPWPLDSPGAKAHFLHLQRPQTLNPRTPTQSSWCRDWVKPRFKFHVWISSSSLSWLLNLHPPCLLLLELCS
jgi:hypothetical protein